MKMQNNSLYGAGPWLGTSGIQREKEEALLWHVTQILLKLT